MTKSRSDHLLESFFAAPNELRLEELSGGTEATTTAPSRLLNQLVADVRADDGRPVLLPRVGPTQTIWYVLLPDRRIHRLISEDVKAFVGATYADLDEMSFPLAGDDPIDAAVGVWIDDAGALLRFKVASTQRALAIEAIGAMHRVWAERSQHLIRAPDGTAPMLRALNRAIAGADDVLAETALDRIRSSGRLSTANLTFSTIRVLEVAGRWNEILGLDELGLVLSIPRPRAVTEALLRAVYWCEVANDLPLGQSPDERQVAAALTVMSRSVLPLYAGLFRAVDGLGAGEALLLFALRAAAAVPPRLEEVRHLVELCNPNDPVRRVIQTIEELIRQQGTVGAAPSVEAGFAAEAVRAEILQARESEGRVRDVQAALEAFGRGPSLATASNALAVLTILSASEEIELHAVNRYEFTAGRVRSLLPLGETEIPDGWISWAGGLRSQPEWPGAIDVVEFAAESWHIESLLDKAGAQAFAVTLMDARSQGGRGAVARALDYLLPATEAAADRGLDVVALATRLITVLLADDVISEADWNFVVGLLACAIAGIEAVDYAETLDEVKSSLVERASPAMIDVSLSTLETVAFRYAPDPSARAALASVIIGICDRFSHRLHRDQLAILEMACHDLGHDYERMARDLAARLLEDTSETTSTEATALNGQSIGIYSLDAAAAQRAKMAIEAAYTGVRVETNAAEVATPGLRQLAQSVDIMIVATRIATHAATIEIDATLRKRGLRPVFSVGKGATSIVRALRDRVAAL